MTSFDQTLTAGPAPSRKGRWNEYAQLSRQIKQAGLLHRRRGYYAAKLGLNAVLLAAGGTVFVALGDSWWQLVTAVYLAVVFTQVAFVGHDAGHRQIFRTRRANDLVGLVHANLLVGVSYRWWVGKHDRHHSNPNHEDLDPDIGIAALAFTAGQARDKRGLVRIVARYQAYLFDGPPSSAHSGRNCGGRMIGPALRAGRAARAIRENQLAATPPFHISDTSPVATYRDLMNEALILE